MLSSFTLKSLDTKALVDELRARMFDELDYRLEAAYQAEFADRYPGHPFVRVPDGVPEYRPAGAHQRVGRRSALSDFVATAADGAQHVRPR